MAWDWEDDITEAPPAKTAHDAVVAVALHRFAEDRRKDGERLTMEAATTVAHLATTLGILPRLSVSELGLQRDFSLSRDELLRTFAQVVGDGCRDELRKLEHALSGLTVVQLDRSAEVADGRSGEARDGSEH